MSGGQRPDPTASVACKRPRLVWQALAQTDYFTDDNGTIHEDAINYLAERALVNGCAQGRYCPANNLTRAQFAAVTARYVRSQEANPQPPEGPTYSAGRYTFRDVQVLEDSLGEFDVRARVTNNGESVDFESWKVTLFNGGTMVGTADGSASDLAAGDTITVEFFSTDDYAAWDALDFQVD